MLDLLLQLISVFAPLSLVAIGGGNSVLPDIHRQVVVAHGWMTDHEFADAFTLAQTVPGPNILVVSLIGWHVAGVAGAFVAVVAMSGRRQSWRWSWLGAWPTRGRRSGVTDCKPRSLR